MKQQANFAEIIFRIFPICIPHKIRNFFTPVINLSKALKFFTLRVMDVEKASSELTVSDKTKSHDIEADSHVLLWPLEFKGRITRRLSDWCTAIPAVSVACRMNRTQVKMNHMSLKKFF